MATLGFATSMAAWVIFGDVQLSVAVLFTLTFYCGTLFGRITIISDIPTD